MYTFQLAQSTPPDKDFRKYFWDISGGGGWEIWPRVLSRAEKRMRPIRYEEASTRELALTIQGDSVISSKESAHAVRYRTDVGITLTLRAIFFRISFCQLRHRQSIKVPQNLRPELQSLSSQERR